MKSKEQTSIPAVLIGMAITLIVVTGLIHLTSAPENFSESAYKGALFAANGIAALVAAFGIYHGSKTWGWGLGLLVAGGALVMYVISRTIGLPGLGVDDAWFEPMGVLSLIIEGAYVVVALKILMQNQTLQQNEPRLTAAS